MSGYYANLRYAVAQRLAERQMTAKLAAGEALSGEHSGQPGQIPVSEVISRMADDPVANAAILSSPWAVSGLLEGGRLANYKVDELLDVLGFDDYGRKMPIRRLAPLYGIRPDAHGLAGAAHTAKGLSRAVHDLWLTDTIRRRFARNPRLMRSLLVPAVGWRTLLGRMVGRAAAPALGAYLGLKSYRWMAGDSEPKT